MLFRSGVGEEVQEVALSVQHSESVPVATTCDQKLEVNKDSCPSAKAGLWERLPAPILALALFDAETGSRGNSQYCSVEREEREKKHSSHTSRVRARHSPHSPRPSPTLPAPKPHTPLSDQYWGSSSLAVQREQERLEVGKGRGKISATTLLYKLILPLQFLIPSHKFVRDRSELVCYLGDRFIIQKRSEESPRSPPTAEKTIKIQNSFPVVGVGDKKFIDVHPT